MIYRISDYKIAHSKNASILEEEVAKYMKKGYTLYGSPFECNGEFSQGLILPTAIEPTANPAPPKDTGIYVH